MRPYTHRQVSSGTVDYGTPTLISSKVISSQCLGPETIYTRYLDRAPSVDDVYGADDDNSDGSSGSDQGAWPPTIVPLNDDDARSLTSQKVISQLLSQHGNNLQKPSGAQQAAVQQSPVVCQNILQQAPPSVPASRFSPYLAPSVAFGQTGLTVAEPVSASPPAYRPANMIPQNAAQVLGRREGYCSPRSLPTAETPRFIQAWEQPVRAPYAVLGKLPSFGTVTPAPPSIAPIVTNRGVTITTLGNALSPSSRVQSALPPSNGVRSQHIVQGGSQSSPPFHPTHPRLVVTDRALAKGRHQRLIKAPPTTGFWESPIGHRRHSNGRPSSRDEECVGLSTPPTSASPGFCHSKFLDTIHRWFGVS